MKTCNTADQDSIEEELDRITGNILSSEEWDKITGSTLSDEEWNKITGSILSDEELGNITDIEDTMPISGDTVNDLMLAQKFEEQTFPAFTGADVFSTAIAPIPSVCSFSELPGL
jgi:hypothetical protein